MTPDRVDELIALAALGELSADEEAELDGAVRADPSLAQELDEALASAAALQHTDVDDAPAGLRSAVLSAIAMTSQEQAPPSTAERAGSPIRSPAALDAHRGRRRRFAPLLAVAAAVLVMIAGAVVIVSTDNGRSDQVVVVVDAFDASTSTLTGELEVLVTYSPSAGAVVVEADGLPTLDDSETYQLWLVDDAGAMSAGVFRPDADGGVSVRFDGVDPTGFLLGVTEEPAGGSDSPTPPILAST